MVTDISLRHPDKLFVGGAWISPAERQMIDIVSPDTERVCARVAEAGRADMEKAVLAARAAFDAGEWPRMRPDERIRILHRLAQKLRVREPELARAWTLQVGGLQSMAPFLAATGTSNVLNAIAVAEKFPFIERAASKQATAALIVNEPVGVVAAIVPWNSPYTLTTSKIAPALAAGCTVILKPSPETPLEAYIITECLEEVGVPPGVVNLVPAQREASDYLVSHPGVDKVSFTGSTATGKRIAAVCSERIARCTLELGGKSAVIVLEDFAVEDAAKILTRTITLMSGQICSMLSRAIVPSRMSGRLAEAIVEEMKRVRVGHSTDADAQMGPLAMKRQFERVRRYVARGQEEGARLLTGGKQPPQFSEGYFMEPTLFAGVDNRMTIAQEEIFGPVLSLISCDGVDDAIRIANESIYGLGGAVLTHDNEMAYKIGRAVRTGKFSQNGMKTDFALPSGGFKQSGMGREGGVDGLKAYLETKTMLLDGYPASLEMAG